MVSPVGFILIPVALILFFRGRRSLLWATFFLLPLTRLEVIYVGPTVLTGYHFFGILFVARIVVDMLGSGEGGIRRSWANIVGALFILVCTISLAMSVVKAGAVEVYIEGGGRWINVIQDRAPLQLSSFNFTQILYPTFGVILFHFLVQEIRSASDLKKAINILLWGTLLVAGMAIAAGLLYTIDLGTTYRDLLSLSVAGELGGYKLPESASFGEFFRSYTVAGEPGFTAVTLLTGVGLLVGLLLSDTSGARGTSVVRAATPKLLVLVAALLFNGSTTGYFGFALMIAWGLIAPWYVGRESLRGFMRSSGYVLCSLGALALAASMVQVSGMSVGEWLFEYHLAKIQGQSGSGGIRWYVTWYSLTEVFPTSPILGVGYGSHRSLSLASFLLSNVGLIGFSVFASFLYLVFRNARTVARRLRSPLGTLAFMVVLAFVPLFGTLFVAKATSALNYGVTWAVLALAEATYQVYCRRRSHQIAQV